MLQTRQVFHSVNIAPLMAFLVKQERQTDQIAEPRNLCCMAGESLGSDDRLGPYTECEVAQGHVVRELPTDLRVLPPTVLGLQLWQEILGAAPSLISLEELLHLG